MSGQNKEKLSQKYFVSESLKLQMGLLHHFLVLGHFSQAPVSKYISQGLAPKSVETRFE